MTFTEGLAIACGLAMGYWFVSSFIRGSRSDRHVEDQDAARERPDAPPAYGGSMRPEQLPPDIPASWHEVLGVERDATPQRINDAYRARLAQYDAGRLEGLAPELRALAELHVARIQDAYIAAMRLHPGRFEA